MLRTGIETIICLIPNFLYVYVYVYVYECRIYACSSPASNGGVRTLRTQDTLDLRQFGSSAEMSVGHFGPFIKC